MSDAAFLRVSIIFIMVLIGVSSSIMSQRIIKRINENTDFLLGQIEDLKRAIEDAKRDNQK